jgi:hypothetical protein
MSRVPNRFTNPADGTFYDWPINHTTEEQFGLIRNYERTAPTKGVGFVRQEGDPTPLTLKMSGTILTATQDTAFIGWFNLARHNSIYFRDWTGAQYEVLFVSYQPQRVRVDWNYSDPNMRTHIIRWDMELEVLRVLSGAWEGAA